MRPRVGCWATRWVLRKVRLYPNRRRMASFKDLDGNFSHSFTVGNSTVYQPDLSPQSSIPMRDEEDHEERSADLMNQMGIDSHMFDTLTLQTCPTGNLVIEAGPSDAVVDVSLVLPTYNEGKDIAAVIEQLMPVLDSVEGMEYEVIVVDDDSPDRTWEIALGLTERYPQLRVVRREGERGYRRR